MGKYDITTISTWEKASIHFLSVFLASWILLKMWVKWLFTGSNNLETPTRDNPPVCLVNNSLGQHKYVKLKRVKFHYVESGCNDQPLMLLLHGFPDCWITWRYQIPFFSAYFRVVALDLKGFGDSDKPIWRRSYNIETILDELKQFILALGVSKCIIVGHDIGAFLGWYLAKENPDLIEKFVSVSCAHPNVFWEALPAHGILTSNWIKFVQIPNLPEVEIMKDDLNVIKKYYAHLQEKNAKDHEILEAYKYTFSRKEDWSGPLNYFRVLPFYRMNKKDPQIKTPTLLVTGNKEQCVNLESLVKSTDYCKKFYVKIVNNTGYYPHQEDPNKFNELLIKFLKVESPNKNKLVDKSPSQRLMDRMFDAVSSTVKYGNSMLDSVNKKTNGVVHIPSSFGLISQVEDRFVQSNEKT